MRLEISAGKAPLIDLVRMETLADALGPEGLAELLQAARRSIIDNAALLQRNWRECTPSDNGRSAHRLSGVAANFGCSALAEVCHEIERACKAGADGREWRQRLEEVVAATLAAFPETLP